MKLERVMIAYGRVLRAFEAHSYSYEPGDLCEVLEEEWETFNITKGGVKQKVKKLQSLKVRAHCGGTRKVLDVPPDHVGWIH